MKRNRNRMLAILGFIAISSASVLTPPALAKDHARTAGYNVLGQVQLQSGKTTDLFLRRSQNGRTFLYVASAGQTLSIFDVTNSSEPREVNHLALATTAGDFRVRPVSDRMAVATAATDPAEQFTVLDVGNAPTGAIAKRLDHVDAYTLDGASNTAYVAQNGRLSIIHFDQPVTREAEIWEQSYEAR